jgi:hypothetical protein
MFFSRPVCRGQIERSQAIALYDAACQRAFPSARPTCALRGAALALILSGICALPAPAAESDSWIDDLGLHDNVPVVSAPEAGFGLGIAVQRKTDSFMQTIALPGDPSTKGQNFLSVTVWRNGLAPRVTGAVVADEMDERMPGVLMTLAPTAGQNAFGAFGYAAGKAGTQTCVYAWQSINNADHWISREDADLFSERHALSIRLRLCRSGSNATALVATMGRLQVGAFASGIYPPGQTSGVDALSAAGGGTATGLMQPMPSAQPVEPAMHPVRRSHPRRRAKPLSGTTPVVAPITGMPTVPMPK